MKYSVYFIATLLALRAFAPSTLSAGDDDTYSPLWACEENEKFAPEGRFVTIGHSRFKHCNSGGAISGPPESGTLRLNRESRIAPEIERDHPNFSYHGILRALRHEGSRYTYFKHNIGVVRVDSVDYSVHISDHNFKNFEHPSPETIGNTTRVYHAVAQGNTPEHYLFCPKFDPFAPSLPKDFNCGVTIEYSPNPSLEIKYTIIQYERSAREAFDFSTLPHLVRGIHRAFELLDVTDILAGPDVITGIAQ